MGVTVLSATPRNFETQSKTVEMPSSLIYQHGNEISREQFAAGVDLVLRWCWYVCVGYSVEISREQFVAGVDRVLRWYWYVCVGYSADISQDFNASEFYILLTVHLVTILVNTQFDAQFFFLIHLFQFSTCFEQPCAHHQESQLYQYDIWYMSLCVGDRLVCTFGWNSIQTCIGVCLLTIGHVFSVYRKIIQVSQEECAKLRESVP